MPFDNSQLQTDRKDILLFDSEEVDGAPMVLVGPLRAKIFASASTPDFDVVVSLYDLYPDGRSIFLSDGILRARFAQGFEDPQCLAPEEIGEFDIDLWHIGHVVRPGHRLRLQIASGSHLRFDVNSCTGNDLADDTEVRESQIRIYYGPSWPSHLAVDVLPARFIHRSA